MTIQILTVTGEATVEIKTKHSYAIAAGKATGMPWKLIFKCLWQLLKLELVADGYEDNKGFHYKNNLER